MSQTRIEKAREEGSLTLAYWLFHRPDLVEPMKAEHTVDGHTNPLWCLDFVALELLKKAYPEEPR